MLKVGGLEAFCVGCYQTLDTPLDIVRVAIIQSNSTYITVLGFLQIEGATCLFPHSMPLKLVRPLPVNLVSLSRYLAAS